MFRRHPLLFVSLALMAFAALAYLIAPTGTALAKLPQSSDRSLQGRIVSAFGPVSEARVRVSGDAPFVVSDARGAFSLKTDHLPPQSLKITAGKDGWFNNAKVAYPVDDAGDLFLNPLPPGDQADYRFVPPTVCAQCHNKLARYWDRSKMAHTTSNPRVLDMYNGTDADGNAGTGPGFLRDNPGRTGDCAVCHAPSAAASRQGSRDLNAALRSPRVEWDGISCDYCHKVRKVMLDPTSPSSMAARLKRHTPPRGNTLLVLGPYDDVVNSAMAAAYSPVFDQGRFCASCHAHFVPLPSGSQWDRRTVYSDAEWAGFGLSDEPRLPVQTTYFEWKQWQAQLPDGDSNKGKTCQNCHMSWRKEMLPYDNHVVDGHAREMWGVYRDPRNIRPHHFDGGTETQLQTALSMEIEGATDDGRLTVNIFITNTNGGHWVPTGETMRSVMLVVNATDSSGKPLELVKGPRLPAWAGDDGRADDFGNLPGAVFARVLEGRDGELHVPFWRATGIAFDTRIRPKTTETFAFEFALQDPDDEPTAEARLIYRPVVKPLAKSKKWLSADITIASRVW